MDGGCKIAASDVFVILQYVGKISEIKSKTGKGMYIPGITSNLEFAIKGV